MPSTTILELLKHALCIKFGVYDLSISTMYLLLSASSTIRSAIERFKSSSSLLLLPSSRAFIFTGG